MQPASAWLLNEIDRAVEQVILRCLEEDLRNRPASELSVAAALPGGDPLAATLAAGETPSPEIAAATGESELISVRTAVVCLAAVVVGVIAAALIFPECNLFSQTALVVYCPQSVSEWDSWGGAKGSWRRGGDGDMPRCRNLVRALLGISIAASMDGQEFRSSISGRVVDAQNAVIAMAKISAVQVETGARTETVTSADGQYTLPFLPPGSYTISAEAPGFKRYVREGFQVSTNDRITLDIALEVGQLAETVTVTAEAAMLQTSTASTGQVISARHIENMPMLGRTPLVLAQLAFGVIPSRDPRFYRPFDNAGPSTFAMGGAPAGTNELLIDGSPDNTGNSRVAYNPPVDAVSEVKVETFQADAAYGHTGGGTVNVVMKGGTNSLHGALYEFNQVSRLAATQFFTNRAGLKKPVTRYNQFGANLGGPLFIPKMFDGRNRIFFYFGWEGVKDSIPAPTISTVPTAAERNGDLSALLRVGTSYQIFDPLTGAVEGTRIRRQPFAGNLIPASRLNPIAQNYLKFYPLPNQAGRIDGQDNYLSNTNGEINNFSSQLGRLDFNLSERHKIFWNLRHNERVGNGGNDLGRVLAILPPPTV
jgi:hypothetical protein